ncbi:hypothetical protein C1646_697227, partial [Rhizophagus diaphanus]
KKIKKRIIFFKLLFPSSTLSLPYHPSPFLSSFPFLLSFSFPLSFPFPFILPFLLLFLGS